jgi:hypothetical protein|tara:strand:- start:1495 stop:1659 length:165 start_codon:yes stop_codon:yes gene_type:complete
VHTTFQYLFAAIQCQYNVRQFDESTKKRVKEVTATLSYFDLLVDNNRNKTIFSG